MFDNMDIGQFYAVTADNRDPSGSTAGCRTAGTGADRPTAATTTASSATTGSSSTRATAFTTVDPRLAHRHTETQNGSVRKLDATFRQAGEAVSPRTPTIMNYQDVSTQEGAAPQFRYNWSSPLILSPHDSKTLYLGGNRLMRSTNRGASWEIISPDLSTKDPELTSGPAPAMGERGGAETHATIISVVESALMRGLIWAGTDDGNVQVTRDGGRTWTNVRGNIPRTLVPPGTWVSRVEPSHFDAGTAYVSFDGHRRDDFKPYVLKTTDFGRTWTAIVSNLPAKSPVYVIKEDLKNPNLLFAGNEIGPYASVDGGASWRRLSGMPIVPVHDLVIHPREGDLIARARTKPLILDDITPLQLTPAVLGSTRMFQNKVAQSGTRSAVAHARPSDVSGPQSLDHSTQAPRPIRDSRTRLRSRSI